MRYEQPTQAFVRDSYKHDLRNLVKAAGIDAQLDADMRANPTLGANWSLVKDWQSTSRYQVWSRDDAQDIFRAVADQPAGVLRWIRRRW
jgi:hypothetical protein